MLNSNLGTYDYFEGTFASSFVKIVGEINLSETNIAYNVGICYAQAENEISVFRLIATVISVQPFADKVADYTGYDGMVLLLRKKQIRDDRP